PEKSKHKSIILFSDGDPDKCRTDECREFLEYDQLIEASESEIDDNFKIFQNVCTQHAKTFYYSIVSAYR
ncbi:hypothetical protein NECAME_18446, partial [Necator americanus]